MPQLVEIDNIEYKVPKIVNILLNQHTLDIRDGEKFCSACRCVWPCCTHILIIGYAKLVEEKEDQQTAKKEKNDV